jgi:cell division protein FtsL
MATLATIFDWLTAVKGAERTSPRTRAFEEADLFEAPPFPNEDVYLYVKRIDNSRVALETDPAARRICWRMIASTFGIVAMVIVLLLPALNRVVAGYEVEKLRNDRERLELNRASLELQESKLSSPERLEELAKSQRFEDPGPNRVVYLENKRDGVLRARASLETRD